MISELYLKKISELPIYAFHCSLTSQFLDKGLSSVHVRFNKNGMFVKPLNHFLQVTHLYDAPQ